MKNSALKISVTSLSACLICLCSWIMLPLGGVPMTLQTFGVAFCGFLLGIRGGVSATAVYLILGAVGLPVFAGFGGSLAFLFGPTGGFLFGFLFLSFFCGTAKRKSSFLQAFLLSLTGLFLCHLFGILWFAYVGKLSFFQSFLLSSLPYLLKDILSVFFARFLFLKMKKRFPNLILWKEIHTIK